MLLTPNIQNFKNKYLLGLVGQYGKRRKSWWFLFISSSISQSLEFNLGWNVLIICASPRWMCLALNALIMITPVTSLILFGTLYIRRNQVGLLQSCKVNSYGHQSSPTCLLLPLVRVRQCPSWSSLAPHCRK